MSSISSIIILEVIGRPPEHLVETLENLINQIGNEKGVKIKERKINEPTLMQNQDNFYTTFAEIEVETENLMYLAILMFKYMPAHIEIISPQNINFSNGECNEVFNELTRRLHGYEEIVRIIQNEKIILENKIKEVMSMKEMKKEISEDKEADKKTKKRKNE